MRTAPWLLLALSLGALAVWLLGPGRGPGDVRGEGGEIGERPLRAPAPADEPSSTRAEPVLAALRERVASLEARLAALESRGAPDPTPPTSVPARPAASLPEEFLREDLVAFRARLEEVERVRRDEAVALGVLQQVRSVEPGLTPEQERAVVEETLRLKASAEALGPGRADAREGAHPRTLALERARSTWTEAVRAAVPGAEGERLVAALGRPIGGQWAGVELQDAALPSLR